MNAGLRSAALLAVVMAGPASAFTATINYIDGAGVGFKDTTPVSPVGGNTGNTLGDQRKQAFEFAVNVWAQRLQSGVTVVIDADFASQFCSPGSATLGQGGPTLVITSGLPQANTYYPAALANAIKGSDVLPANNDIAAHFNIGIDTKPPGGCLGTKKYYYGLDQNFGSDISFINVAVHEIGHGLGFTSLVNAANGQGKFGDGKFGIFDYSLFDETTSLFLPAENDSQRAAVAISGTNLTWNDTNTNAGSSFLAAGRTNNRARMFAPNPSQSGSSISHWDTTASPDLVMEPVYTPLDGGAHVDLTTCAFLDMGWTLSASFACPDVAGGTDLSLTKVENADPVLAGNNLTYTLTLNNLGSSAASNVSVTDVLPSTLSFVSLAKPAGWSSTTPAVGATGTVTLTKASVASAESAVFTLVVKVKANVLQGATINNTATVSSATSDPTPANNAATASTSVNASANLTLAKVDSPDPVIAGNTVTYTLTLQNRGPSYARNVSVSDPLPASLTFVSASAPAGWTVTTPAVGANGTVSFTNPALAGVTATFTIVAKVAASIADAVVIKNTATASSTTTDPVPGSNQPTASTTVQRRADLAATNADTPDPVHVNNNISYTLKVTNNGPSNGYNLSLSDSIPANTTFVSLNSAGTGWSCTTPSVGGTGTVNCTASVIGPGAQKTFTLVVKVDPATANGSTITNTATISTATTDPTPANNSANATTGVQNP